MRVLWLILTSALLSASCSPVQLLEQGVCGNGVVDADNHEDCDGHKVDGFDCRPVSDPWPCSFSCNAKGECPAGYGCGADGVCRLPTGEFDDDAITTVPSQALELLVGDFDADGRDDVVGVEPGRVRIHFMAESGDVQQATIPTIVRPSIGKLGPLIASEDEPEVDLTDDLVVPLNLGLGSLLSQGDQTFAPHTYGSLLLDALSNKQGVTAYVAEALPMALDALPVDDFGHNTGDETAALFALKPMKEGEPLKDGVFADFSAKGGGPVFFTLDTLPSQLSGPPVTGNFDDDLCEEIAFPKTNSDLVAIYKPCQFEVSGYKWVRQMPGDKPPVIAEIDIGGPSAGPVFAFDVNGDDKLDFVATVKHPIFGYQLRVALALGSGKFDLPLAVGPGEPPRFGTSTYALLPNNRAPLALGHLDDDETPDIVDATQVLLGGPTSIGDPSGALVTFNATYTSQRFWTEAVIADINANGAADVIACQEGAPDIDILNGTHEKFLNPLQVSTDGTVAHLAVGDYDGDLVTDIVFQDALSKNESLLMVAYGRTAGGPEEPSEIANFPDIRLIVSGDVHTFGTDNITDLGVLSRSEDGTLALSFLPGAGNRIMQTPYLLSDPETQTVQLPVQTGIGALRRPKGGGAKPHEDLAVLAFNPPEFDPENPMGPPPDYFDALRMWGLYGKDDADFEQAASGPCKMPYGAFFFPGLEPVNSVVVLDAADGGDRAIVGTPYASLEDMQVHSVLTEVLFAEGTCEAGEPFTTGAGALLFGIQAVDLDLNGMPEIIAVEKQYDPVELVTLLELQGGGALLNVQSSRLVIFWDAELGSGGDLAPYSPPDQPNAVSAFTVGDIDGDASPDVLVVGEGGLVRYAVSGDRGLVAGEKLGLDLAGARAILLADATGDGALDLVAAGAGLQFFQGKPKAEVEKLAGENGGVR